MDKLGLKTVCATADIIERDIENLQAVFPGAF